MIIHTDHPFEKSNELRELFNLLKMTQKVSNVMIESRSEGMYYGKRFQKQETFYRLLLLYRRQVTSSITEHPTLLFLYCGLVMKRL